MTRTLFVLLPLVATGCEVLGLDPAEPWNGETIYYFCHHGEVQYTHQNSIMPGTANPAVNGCYALPDPDNLPWLESETVWNNTLYSLCLAECSHQVELEAATLGRDVLGDTCYEIDDEDISWTRSNCEPDDASHQQQQDVALTYTSVVGPSVSARGTVSYAVQGGPAGDTLELIEVALADPLSVVTGVRDATALLGFPEGTLLSVDQVALLPVSVPLDREGNGVLTAGSVAMEARVTIREPGEPAVTQRMSARIPFQIEVGTDAGLSVGAWSDGFGGRFSVE
jgi:hypothetical protein